MSYVKAAKILPAELVQLIQEYIDGEMIYIPKKESKKEPWGAGTGIRTEMQNRNAAIYQDYCSGRPVSELADQYFLSTKSIHRIILNMKREYV